MSGDYNDSDDEQKLELEYEAFFDLVESNDLAAVSERLSADATWANAGFEGLTRPLHRARTFEMVELLIRHGADINVRGVADEMTALQRAAKEGRSDVAKALIANGADLDAVDARGHTALLWATQDPFEGDKIVRMLLDAGANFDIDSAVSRPDIVRIREIIAKDPEAVQRIANVEGTLGRLLCVASINEPQACEVLTLILENGFRVTAAQASEYSALARDQDSRSLAKVIEESAHLSR
jgi:ankyrin repeat protein